MKSDYAPKVSPPSASAQTHLKRLNAQWSDRLRGDFTSNYLSHVLCLQLYTSKRAKCLAGQHKKELTVWILVCTYTNYG